MNAHRPWLRIALFFAALALASRSAAGGEPAPEAGSPCRPGNVFLEGEPVAARFPEAIPEAAVRFRALDDRGLAVREGAVAEASLADRRAVALGKLPIGCYRVEAVEASGAVAAWTTAAVLARLDPPPPEDTPVAVDAAVAWFARDDPAAQREFAHLAALAGARWVRDRLSWREIEPARGSFAPPPTTYDTSASIQTEEGLRILQVFHDTPAWAADRELDGERARGRFARDLRDLHALARALGRRFRGRVRAWEPWNEANIQSFGGHTVDEMCSWQKAAYLGFKAGDPEAIVGWNAYTGAPTATHAQGIVENETWPYFDTYNIHSYDWPESYEELWGPAREAASGKPIWVTEADRGAKYVGPKPWCELSREDEIRKAEHLAQEYATSLFSGASRHFHFILGHYTEDWNGVQFGLLRLDRTPRPAYAALAALGRLLAGARPLGRWKIPESPEARVYVFRSLPDGAEAEVLVAWAESGGDWSARGKTEVPWSLPESLEPRACYDYLGRPLGPRPPERLRGAAAFVLLPPGSAGKLPLEAPRAPGPPRSGAPSPVVLQAQLPVSRIRKEKGGPAWSEGYAYGLGPDEALEVPVLVYNFSEERVAGDVRIESVPAGVTVEPGRWEVAVPPGERTRIAARCAAAKEALEGSGWIRLRGEFGAAGRPALAFRFVPR